MNQYLINGAITIIVTLLMYILNRPKQKKDTELVVTTQWNMLVGRQTEIIKQQGDEIALNKATIEEEKKKNEICEYKHDVTKLQMKLFLKQIDLNNIPKSTIFVLDDNEMVIMEFRKEFREIPVLDSRFFTDPKIFLQATQEERPPIVVLDYILGPGITADDIIVSLGYTPEVFIMSQDKSIQLRFIEKKSNLRFFYKGEYYVNHIAKAIVKYLIHKEDEILD